MTLPRPQLRLSTAAILRRYAAGESVKVIAASLGCAVPTVYKRLQAAGYQPTNVKRPDISTDDIVAMQRSGATQAKIAAAFGISTSAVYQRLAARGLTGHRRSGFVQGDRRGPWTDREIGTLRTMWAEGRSTLQIADRLDRPKNAIIGKAHRLDLDARPSPIRRAA